MNAIDNSGFLNVCYSNCGNNGFLPGLSYSYVPNSKLLTITDTSAFGAGDGLKAINIVVTDKFGKVKHGRITVAAGNVVIDLSTVATINPSLGFVINATVVTNFRAIGDLSIYDVANPLGSTSGQLGYLTEAFEGNGMATVEP